MPHWLAFGRTRKIGRLALLMAALALAGQTPAARVQSFDDLDSRRQAAALWQGGYALHRMHRYRDAVALYRRSIALLPTAEGHTYLGWALSRLGRLEEAITESNKAIPLDPDYGNPYNDIGSYLIRLGRPDEAVPWLEKAIASKRYCCYQFPQFSMGRILLAKGRIEAARRAFERALGHDPGFAPAKTALERLRAARGIAL